MNSASKDLLPYEETLIEMIIPSVPLNENEKFIIKLSLANLHPIEASWSLKKRKTCLCNDETMKYKSVIRRNSRDGCLYCIHDQSCTIAPKKISLKVHDFRNVHVKY